MKCYNIIACDGACDGYYGGYAAIYFKEDENGELLTTIRVSGVGIDTTNNQMELKAFIDALKLIRDTVKEPTTILCDSAYVTNCIFDKWYVTWQRNGWRNSKGERVKNKELWEELIALYLELAPFITIQKVKGHSDNKYNNLADELAVERKNEIKTKYININKSKSDECN